MVGRDSKASAVRGMAAMFVKVAARRVLPGTRETSGLGLGLRPTLSCFPSGLGMARDDDFDIGVNNNIVSSIGSSSGIVVGSLAVSHDGGGGGGERTPLLVERFLGSLSIGSHWQSSSHASTGDEASLGHEPSSSVSCCGPRDDELDASKMKRKPEHAPPAEATWQQIAVVIIAEVVGVGVLSLPVAVAKV